MIRFAATVSAISLCLIAAGCGGMQLAPTKEPVPAAAPAAAAALVRSTAVERPVVVITPETVTASIATAPVPQVAAAKPPPAVSAAPTPAPEAAPAPKTAMAPVITPTTVAPLDLKSLGTRLRQTKIIGILTKLAVKYQADNLVNAFRAYHKRQGTATLPELRRSYDMLLLKVVALLKDGDPPLAREIVQSRAAIWDILADPRKFTESNLMAGATR